MGPLSSDGHMLLRSIDKVPMDELKRMAAKQAERLSESWRRNFAVGVQGWRQEHHCPLIYGRVDK